MKKGVLLILLFLNLYANNDELKIGYLSKIFDHVEKKSVVKSELESYFESLKKKSKIDISYKFYDDGVDIVNSFKRGEVNMIFIDGFTYLDNYKTIDNFISKYLDIKQGDKAYAPLLLVVNSLSKVNLISDLEKSVFTIQKNDGLSELFLKYLVKEYKLGDAKSFFSEIIYRENPSRVLLSIFFNKSKSCIIQENNYNKELVLNPQIATRTKILKKSPPLYYVMALVRKEVSDKVLNVVNNELKYSFEVDRNHSSLFKIEDINEINKKNLDIMKAFYNSINQ